MPIKACADKLRNEYAAYGKPLPNFPTAPPAIVSVDGTAITLVRRAVAVRARWRGGAMVRWRGDAVTV